MKVFLCSEPSPAQQDPQGHRAAHPPLPQDQVPVLRHSQLHHIQDG